MLRCLFQDLAAEPGRKAAVALRSHKQDVSDTLSQCTQSQRRLQGRSHEHECNQIDKQKMQLFHVLSGLLHSIMTPTNKDDPLIHIRPGTHTDEM